MTKQINVTSGFRTSKQDRNSALREALGKKQSIRGFLLGFVACLVVAGAALYEIAIRFA